MYLGSLISGLGIAAFFSFGIPYVDDNSEKDSSPLKLSIVLAARMTGPAVGYAIGAVFLKVSAHQLIVNMI